jgi:hypothetical protein
MWMWSSMWIGMMSRSWNWSFLATSLVLLSTALPKMMRKVRNLLPLFVFLSPQTDDGWHHTKRSLRSIRQFNCSAFGGGRAGLPLSRISTGAVVNEALTSPWWWEAEDMAIMHALDGQVCAGEGSDHQVAWIRGF